MGRFDHRKCSFSGLEEESEGWNFTQMPLPHQAEDCAGSSCGADWQSTDGHWLGQICETEEGIMCVNCRCAQACFCNGEEKKLNYSQNVHQAPMDLFTMTSTRLRWLLLWRWLASEYIFIYLSGKIRNGQTWTKLPHFVFGWPWWSRCSRTTPKPPYYLKALNRGFHEVTSKNRNLVLKIE